MPAEPTLTKGLAKEQQGMGRLKPTHPQELEILLPFCDFLDLPDLDYMTLKDLLDLSQVGKQADLIFILMNLFAARQEGSLCLHLEKHFLLKRFPRNLKDRAGQLLDQFLRACNLGQYANLIGSGPNDYLPLIRVSADGRNLIYFQKYFFHESQLRQTLQGFLGGIAWQSPSQETLVEVIDEIYDPLLTIRVGADEIGIVRDETQVKALEAALRSNLAIISGGPGTGKTSLMVNLLRCLSRCGIAAEEILLGAPTGRAAQRMTEALLTHLGSIRHKAPADQSLLNVKGSTLHRILRYDASRHRFMFGPARRLSAKAIILDEVSMVDVVMMDHLLQAIDPQTTRLILLGDKDQLPSVEAGAVLADLIPAEDRGWTINDRLVILKTAFRSGERLVRLAEEINSGTLTQIVPMEFSEALTLGEDRFAFVPATDSRKWREHLMGWANQRYLASLGPDQDSYLETAKRAAKVDGARLSDDPAGRMLLNRMFQAIEKSRILCLIRRGIYGCDWVNTLIGAVLSQAFGPLAGRMVPGTPVMILRNDYAMGLFNGDVGIALCDRQGIERVFFRKPDGYLEFAMDGLPPWEPAFAMTVHKSQGSEFGDVLLVLPESADHRLLTREMIYTAVTRAKKRVIIYGSQEALLGAISKRIQRQTGMLWESD